MTDISKRQRAHYIYTKSETFLNTKAKHFSKAGQFPLRFYIQKARHVTLRDFS